MNKRIKEKLRKQFDDGDLTRRKSCIYCADWGYGCANGHPRVFPGDASDYLNFCKEKFETLEFFVNQLKREGLSLSGWILEEIPAPHTYAFYNTRNHKSIEIMYDTENECFEIYSTDCLWKYSKDYNSYKYDTLREALCAPWQHLNYIMVMERNNSNKKKRRNRTIQTQKYKEEKIAVKKEMQHFEACNW